MSEFQHWQVSTDDDNIVTLLMDSADKSVNVLTIEMMTELAAISEDLCARADTLQGVMLLSGKVSGFCYGADIGGFESFADEAAVLAHLNSVHQSFQRIAGLACPTAAGIDGFALGGGLEIALAFKTIIAADSPKTQLAFPEVKLGLLPGYGGTGRGFARVGAGFALEMMTTGRMIAAREAYEAGLIDALAASPEEPAASGQNGGEESALPARGQS